MQSILLFGLLLVVVFIIWASLSGMSLEWKPPSLGLIASMVTLLDHIGGVGLGRV